MNLAAFDLMPTQTFYDTYLPSPPTDGPMNDNFNALGFGSMYFLNNLGSMIVGLLSLPILMAVLFVIKFFKSRNKRIEKIYKALNEVMFWEHPITLTNETFWIVCLSTFVNSTIVSTKALIFFRSLLIA
jgi:hypothetical protein